MPQARPEPVCAGLLVLPRLAPGHAAAAWRLSGIAAADICLDAAAQHAGGRILPHAGAARDRAGDPGRTLMRIALVVAVADNGVIGRDQHLPWHLPDDLRHFKAVTMGKPILMGRRTLESIGRALPGRRNLVLTHAASVSVPGVETVASLAEALERCSGEAQLCVIGGAELYRLTLPLASDLYLTRVHGNISGD